MCEIQEHFSRTSFNLYHQVEGFPRACQDNNASTRFGERCLFGSEELKTGYLIVQSWRNPDPKRPPPLVVRGCRVNTTKV